VNILLYGAPGTGKTSFAATLAARVGARLRPVAEADDDGNEPNRDRRLAGLCLAQRLADIGALGPAVLRRMTMCLACRVPNLATRTVLWRR
jgi:SpoVK/Ycf46/Vps4 family AAA+-type ATPase